VRAWELGIRIGSFAPGPNGDITDVAGVEVGHTTIVAGDGPLVRGQGPVRTGVTAIWPGTRLPWLQPVPAGSHRLNGNGEMTGLTSLDDGGLLATPLAITNTHSVGVVRDALVAYEWRDRPDHDLAWSMPVVGETYDGVLSDINGFHVTAAHADAALAAASAAAVPLGAVGGGTGMICHEFKGGIGSASRALPADLGGWTVGALVQANYGRRSTLRVDGVPVGRVLTTEVVPSPFASLLDEPEGLGSIIVVLATDAPLSSLQCQRVARRATVGLARVGGGTDEASGDIFVCFATGNQGREPGPNYADPGPLTVETASVVNAHLSAVFEAAADAVEDAILNALLAAETTTGRDGITAYGLDADLLLATMRAAGWRPTLG
jgi:D-aminopeptidase